MKITGIEIKQYAKPLDPPFLASWDPNPRVKFASTIVYVYTDEVITGIGSGDLMTGFAGHEKFFIGKDPFEMENHNKIIDNIDFHYGRCWPLDIALWDIIGKKCGQPIYKLLGGKQDKIKAYCSCGARIPAEERAEKAREYVEMGFKAMKIRFHHEDVREDIKVVEAVRGAIGDKMEIMVDGNQAWKMPWDVERIWDLKKAVKVARELEKLGVYWLEEPLHHADYDNLARLREMTDIRIAGGEMNRRWHDFRDLADKGSYDVYQPDTVLCGGFTRTKKIADYVQSKGAVFCPHTWSNGVGLLANLHMACAVSDAEYLEYPFDPPVWTVDRRDYILKEEDRVLVDKDGYMHVPQKPGLGFEPDEEALKEYEIKDYYVGE